MTDKKNIETSLLKRRKTWFSGFLNDWQFYKVLEDFFFVRLVQVLNRLTVFNYLERRCCFCKKQFKVPMIILRDNTSLFEKEPEKYKDRFHNQVSFTRAVKEGHRISMLQTAHGTFSGISRKDLYFFIIPFFQWTFCLECDNKQFYSRYHILIFLLRSLGSIILSLIVTFLLVRLYIELLDYLEPQPQFIKNLFPFLYWGSYLIGTVRVILTHGIFTASKDKF